MDVSCPRCRTEYELDDARVPTDGVTVKCTQCAHVFRVKRKEMVITLPVKPEDAQGAQEVSELPPPPPSREWKVRQTNGNVFVCRELTTLQKWIVEGKVGRDAEISLSGDTWKRLGNIPELASFFQIVDEATKARALEAIRSVNTQTQPNLPPSPPAAPGAPAITDTWKQQQFSTPYEPKPEPSTEATQPGVPAAPALPPPPLVFLPPNAKPTGTSGSLPGLSPPPGPLRKDTVREPALSPPASKPTPARAYEALDDDPADDLSAVRSHRGIWLGLILVGLCIGGGLGYYWGFYLPEQQRLERESKETADRKAAEEAKQKADAERAAREQAERKAREDELDASVQAALAAAQDAGVDAGAAAVAVAAVDAGSSDGGKVAAEPTRSYDWYLAQGDRLRDREKPDQALNMYGRAVDLKPDSAEPLAGRGLALLDLGQLLAAQAAFEQALKLNGRYGPAIMGMAESYRAQNKNDKAIEWYQRYLEVAPDGTEANVARNNIERLKK